MSEWRDIATAPKDGTSVLVYGCWAGEINGEDDKPSIYIARWTGGGDYLGFDWSVDGTDAYAAWVSPRFWQPLPAPPEDAEK